MINKLLSMYQKNIDNILISLLFLLAGLNFFQNINSGILTLLTMLVLFITLTSFISYDKKSGTPKIVINSKLSSIAIVTIIYILYLFFSNKIIGTNSSYPAVVNWIFIIATMALVMIKNISNVKLTKISKIYCGFMFVLLLLCIIMNFNNTNRGIMNFFGYSYDPNVMGLNFIFPALLALHYFINEKNKFRWFFLLFILSIIFFGFLAGSRGVTISLVAGIVVYLIAYLFSLGKIKINLKKVLICLVILTLLLAVIIFVVPENTLERFRLENMLNFGGRLGIWIKSLKTFISASTIEKLLGFGAGTFKYVVDYFKYGHLLVAHNFVFSILIEYGFFGLGIFLGILGNTLYSAFKKKNFFVLSAIISMILIYLTLDIDMLFWINLTICEVILNNKELNELFAKNKSKRS